MFTVVVNVRTGDWEFKDNLRVLEIEWFEEFEELLNETDPKLLIKMANAFGKSLK